MSCIICVVNPIIVSPLFSTMYSKDPTTIFSKRTFAPPEIGIPPKYQRDQDLCFQLVTTGRCNRSDFDYIDKCRKSCNCTCKYIDEEFHLVCTDTGEHCCFLTGSDCLSNKFRTLYKRNATNPIIKITTVHAIFKSCAVIVDQLCRTRLPVRWLSGI